jgi:hypothetical protein
MKRVDRVEETVKVEERILALESVAAFTAPLNEDAEEILEGILDDYKARLVYLRGAKEYMVHFVGGGWNTCYGIDETDAFSNAEIEHNSNDDVIGIDQDQYAHVALRVKSVSLATKAGKEAAMRLFY